MSWFVPFICFHKSEVALISRSTALIGQISDRLWMHHIPLQLTRSSGAQSACCSDCFASESSPIKELPTSAPCLFVYSLAANWTFLCYYYFTWFTRDLFSFFPFFHVLNNAVRCCVECMRWRKHQPKMTAWIQELKPEGEWSEWMWFYRIS